MRAWLMVLAFAVGTAPGFGQSVEKLPASTGLGGQPVEQARSSFWSEVREDQEIDATFLRRISLRLAELPVVRLEERTVNLRFTLGDGPLVRPAAAPTWIPQGGQAFV